MTGYTYITIDNKQFMVIYIGESTGDCEAVEIIKPQTLIEIDELTETEKGE